MQFETWAWFFSLQSDVIVESNVREVKVHSPDYKGVEADEVCTNSYRSHFVVPDGIQKLVFHLLLFFLMCCYILGHHRLPWEDKALRRNLWANLRGGRGPLFVHQALQRRGEVRDPQARGIPPVEDCLLDHERAHHTENDLSHQTWRVRTQQARKVSIGSTSIRAIDQ